MEKKIYLMVIITLVVLTLALQNVVAGSSYGSKTRTSLSVTTSIRPMNQVNNPVKVASVPNFGYRPDNTQNNQNINPGPSNGNQNDWHNFDRGCCYGKPGCTQCNSGCNNQGCDNGNNGNNGNNGDNGNNGNNGNDNQNKCNWNSNWMTCDQSDFDLVRNLQLVDDSNSGASANADVFVKINGTDKVLIKINVNDPSLPDTEVDEAWLVDENSGYALSLGTFTGNKLVFMQNMVNFLIYDKILITREPQRDTDPLPGTEILSASLTEENQTIPTNESDHIFNFHAELIGANEVPGTNSTAFGDGDFELDTDEHTLRYDITYSNLNGVETGAHLHGPAVPGENAPVLMDLPSGSHKIGVWQYDDPSVENYLMQGEVYVNVHSNIYPDGEIRGWLIQQ